jgi:6-phosphogluconolactonase
MYFNVMVLIMLCSFHSLFGQHSGMDTFYTGTFTSEGAEGIYQMRFDSGYGKIQPGSVFKGIDNPNFLCKSPDGRFLYSVSRSPQSIDPTGGTLVAYQITEGGLLKLINKQSSHGADPCHLDVSSDGKWLAVANYGGGSVAVYPLGEGGDILPATAIVKHKGSGPNPERQREPHAHAIKFSSDGNRLYAADLGTDQLIIYRLNKTSGMLIPGDQPFVTLPPGSGPRHFVFTADESYCFVANELNSTVTVMEFRGEDITVLQTLSTLPDSFSGTNYCADIHLAKDEKYLYVSNRGHQTLAVFSRGEDGKLELVENVFTQGDWPRNFTIHPEGRFMLVANQKSNNIAVFELQDGIPVFTGEQVSVPSPVCLEF